MVVVRGAECGCAYIGAGVHGKSLYFLLNFPVNLRLPQKWVVIFYNPQITEPQATLFCDYFYG